MSNTKPQKFSGFLLYRIYYGNEIVYVGRTMQPLQTRMHDHFFKKPMVREIDINQVTKIEYTTFTSQADQYVMEIYFINLWKPKLNKDDKAADSLTLTLPEATWTEFKTPLMDKWIEQIAERDVQHEKKKLDQYELKARRTQLRKDLRSGTITEDEFEEKMIELEEQLRESNFIW